MPHTGRSSVTTGERGASSMTRQARGPQRAAQRKPHQGPHTLRRPLRWRRR